MMGVVGSKVIVNVPAEGELKVNVVVDQLIWALEAPAEMAPVSVPV